MDYSYHRNEAIIRSKTREFFGVGAVVTASSYLVLVVDFMLIGWILGSDALAAAGLCDSFVDLAELPGFVFSSSGPIVAGIMVGRRQFGKANQVFTFSFIFTIAGSLLCWCLLPFCNLFGDLLTNNGAISGEVARYAFYTIASSPFIGIELVLSGFAILDNHPKLAMGSVIVANVVNVALDIVFMKFLEMGVAGASLASLIGNAIGIFVCMPYLFFKDRTLRFSFSFSQSKEVVSELIASSSSFAVDKISRVVSGFIVNVLLIYFSGNMAVALYAVYGRLKFILKIIAGGALQTISSLGSLLYGERDFFGLGKMFSILIKYTYSMIVAIELLLFLFTKQFLLSYGILIQSDTQIAFRIMLLSLPVFWLNDLLSRLYSVIQRQKLSVLLFSLQNLVFRVLILLLFALCSNVLDVDKLIIVGIWCFAVELLSLLITLVVEKLRYKNIAIFDMKDFASPDCHAFSISANICDVDNVHREIESFCNENGISKKKGIFLSLAFEEVVLFIIKQNKNIAMIDICLFLENGNLVVRIRDNGAQFNPLSFVDDEDILRLNNINLLDKLTSQRSYTRIMNMNNTVLFVKLDDE